MVDARTCAVRMKLTPLNLKRCVTIDVAKIVNSCQCNCSIDILSRTIFALMLINESHAGARRLKFLDVGRHITKEIRNTSETAEK